MNNINEAVKIYESCGECKPFPYVSDGVLFTKALNNQIVGFLYMKDNSFHEVDILYVGVLESCRGQGFASELIQKAQNKYEKIFIEVNCSNIPALQLYKKNNFQISRKRLHYYGPNQDAFEMLWVRNI